MPSSYEDARADYNHEIEADAREDLKAEVLAVLKNIQTMASQPEAIGLLGLAVSEIDAL